MQTSYRLTFDENTYSTLVQRHEELKSGSGESGNNTEIPFDIDGYITEIDMGKIDADFMNSRFNKYLIFLSRAILKRQKKH